MVGLPSNCSDGGCSWPRNPVIENEQEPKSASNSAQSHTATERRSADPRPWRSRLELEAPLTRTSIPWRDRVTGDLPPSGWDGFGARRTPGRATAECIERAD